MPMTIVDLHDHVRDLLQSGDVKQVLGYAAGAQPLTAQPVLVQVPTEAKRLIFDQTCHENLANYLHRHKNEDGKTAIVVKGCDARSVIGLMQEKQVKRESLILLGAPCTGVIDRMEVMKASGFDCIDDAVLESDTIKVTACGKTKTVRLEQVLYRGCLTCSVRNPHFADVYIAEPVEQQDAADLDGMVATVEAMPSEARWQLFEQEMKKCILCMACRNVCPSCYCSECFAESSQPKWMSRSSDPGDAAFFHLARLLHLTGRCTGCGACARACPVNVNLRLYNDKLRKDVKEIFNYVAGSDPETEAPMTAFKNDDPNDFIM